MLNQKKIEIFLTKIRKSLAKQFLEIAFNYCSAEERIEIQYQIKQISTGIIRLIDSLQKKN